MIWLVCWGILFVDRPDPTRGICQVSQREFEFIKKHRDPSRSSLSLDAAQAITELGNDNNESGTKFQADAKGKVKAIPWGSFMTTPQFWGVIFGLFAANWISYIFMTWLPTYLSREHGMSLQQSGVYSFLPILAKGSMAPVVGSIAQLMQRKGVRVIGKSPWTILCFFSKLNMSSNSPVVRMRNSSVTINMSRSH